MIADDRAAVPLPMEGLAEWHFPQNGVIQVVTDPEGSLITLVEQR